MQNGERCDHGVLGRDSHLSLGRESLPGRCRVKTPISISRRRGAAELPSDGRATGRPYRGEQDSHALWLLQTNPFDSVALVRDEGRRAWDGLRLAPRSFERGAVRPRSGVAQAAGSENFRAALCTANVC